MTQRSLRNRPLSMRQMAAFRQQQKYANANFARDDRNPNYLGVAGTAALGAGGIAATRYGVAEGRTRLAQRGLDKGMEGATLMPAREAIPERRNAIPEYYSGSEEGVKRLKRAQSGGARGAAELDVERAKRLGGGIADDFKGIGKEYNRSIDQSIASGLGQGGNLKRGSRLGAGLNSGRKFLLGTNTGRAGLAVGALGAGYAGYRALRGND